MNLKAVLTPFDDFRYVIRSAFLMTMIMGFNFIQAQDTHEAENINLASVTIATAYSGYTGNGYVTDITSEWSFLGFDKGNSETQSARLDIRYANGTGANINNLALYVGSSHVQDLVFPPTASWSDWSTLSVTFVLPAGYQNIKIDGISNVATSVNIDRVTLTLGANSSPPGTFTQNNPANGATGVSTTPTFTWSAASGAASYSLIVSANSNLSGPIINESNIASTDYVATSALANNTTYYWRVSASNANGTTISSNANLSFTTEQAPTAPGPFSQSSPANNASDVSTQPAFSWTPASGASSYSIKVSVNSDLSSPLISQAGITQTSYNGTSGLSQNTTYYWEVQAVNNVGSTVATNAGISFTTEEAPPAPGNFALTSPANGSSDISVNPSFSWANSSNANTYTLEVATNSNFSNVIINESDITSTSYSPSSTLQNNSVYYWRVTAVNGAGSQTSNAAFSFTTEEATTPPSGEVYEAENQNISNGTIASGYSGYSGSGYVTGLTSEWSKIQFDKGVPSTTPMQMIIRYANNHTSSISHMALYVGSTRIQGLVFPSTGSWTSWDFISVNFTIPAGYQNIQVKAESNASASVNIDYIELVDGSSIPPGSFSLSSPADGATNVGLSTQLSWTTSSNASSYLVVLDDNSDFSSPLISQSVSGTSYTPTGLVYSKTYYWKVTAVNQNGSANSGVRSFRTLDPPPLPGSFSHSSPQNNATGVATNVTLGWTASSNAASYSVKVSTNSNLSSPVVDVSGITSTSYNVSLSDGTTYFWQVTATNTSGATVATKTSFTTLVPPPPGAFTLASPAASETDVSRFPQFSWNAASNANTYTLIVDDNSNFSSPVINESGISSTSYSSSVGLAALTTYYWKVSAVNSVGTTNASNNGISFTTSDVATGSFYVSTSGSNTSGSGSINNPWKTIAFAVSQIPAAQNNTLFIAPGTYVETEAIKVPVGVNLEGAGEDQVTITANGPIPAPPGIDEGSGDWKLWYYGSLIQLYSGGYQGGDDVLYGSPSEMIPSTDGNQYLTGFTVDGANEQVKAGIWVQNRNNVTMHHVTIRDCEQRGAVFTRSDMWWYEPLPDGMWMYNTTIHDCKFYNNGAQLGGETLGNLCLGGLDGANIYNLEINDDVGYGIKFIMVGHYRNVDIHHCDITVSESDAQWGEKISIELWNLDQGNKVHDITCNTWHSYVNHPQLIEYEPQGTEAENLKVYNVSIIDQDGASSKEAIESALPGVQIYDCYIQDKGFGIAIWGGSGPANLKNFIIHNNIITNVNRTPGFGFGNSAAIFVPDPADNIKIYNNVFDRMGVALDLGSATNVEVKNNAFLFTEGDDVKGGSGTASNNLKYHTNSQKSSFISSLSGSNNITGAPGFSNTGDRATTYYEPASENSLVVDAGVDVGLNYSGAAPDIGRWEYNSVPTSAPGAFSLTSPANNATNVSVNPTLSWASAQYAQSYTVEVASNSNFSNIVFTQNGISSTSTVVSTTLDYTTEYFWRVRALNVVGSTLSSGSFTFTTQDVPPPPGSFSMTAPANNATNVSKTPQFTWQASANASSYTLVVSVNSNLSSPVINQTSISGTSYTSTVVLADNTKYYWRITAVNAVGTATASNSGISFTTTTAPVTGNGLVNYERWLSLPGNKVSNLTGSPDYPNNPSSSATLTSVDVPRDQGSEFGQKLWGYLRPTQTGSYQFWVAGDDEVQFFLSTDATKANKVLRASVPDWTNPEQYDKYGSQASGSVQLTAGGEYYFEVLHKEADGGDHATLAWQAPGASGRSTLSGTVMSSTRNTVLPTPGSFTLSSPANSATGVSRVPTLSWTASSLVETYTLVVSTNSNLSNPIVSEAGLTNTSYTLTEALSTSTTYYWSVTAYNEGGSLVASNAPRSFTTEAQPLPGSFSPIQPADGVTGVSWNPFFSWGSAFEANSYTFVLSTNSNLSNPLINQTGITGTSYTVVNSLSGNTTYYWRVTAVNTSGSVAMNGGTASFTTGAQDGLYHVSLTGSNSTGDGTSSLPWRTVAYAATQVPANQGKTIFIHPGTFNETSEIHIPTGVNVLGSGEGVTILKAGSLGSNTDEQENEGSLLQLVSQNYVVDQFSPAVAPANGNQVISGFTIDGSNALKTGLWIQNRNNVTVHHVTIKDCAMMGAVADFGKQQGKQEPPFYISGLVMHDMTFLNAGSDQSGFSLGNLNIGQTNGADIYNITIDDQKGYGIKFIHEGYHKNTKVHDCIISVNEEDPLWTEDIAIELWNLGPGNEVYNIEANTWLSFVNWANTFNNPAAAGDNLKVYNCKIIDNDGTSLKEAIEVACSGTDLYNNYISNKGWGIAVWLQAERKTTIRNNIFYNSQPQAVWADAGAVFIVADNVPQMEDIRIYNNVFDNLVTGGGAPLKVVSVWKGTVSGLDIANNVSTNMLAETYDFYLYGAASVSNASYRNNLRDIAHNVTGISNQSANIVGDPGFMQSGFRWADYYKPASSSSLVVDAGVDVGLPYLGSAPDIGRWELASSARIAGAEIEKRNFENTGSLITELYPNPVKEKFSLKFSKSLEGGLLTIFNLNGIAVKTFEVHGNSVEVDFEEMPHGMYFVSVHDGINVQLLKIMKL